MYVFFEITFSLLHLASFLPKIGSESGPGGPDRTGPARTGPESGPDRPSEIRSCPVRAGHQKPQSGSPLVTIHNTIAEFTAWYLAIIHFRPWKGS